MESRPKCKNRQRGAALSCSIVSASCCAAAVLILIPSRGCVRVTVGGSVTAPCAVSPSVALLFSPLELLLSTVDNGGGGNCDDGLQVGDDGRGNGGSAEEDGVVCVRIAEEEKSAAEVVIALRPATASDACPAARKGTAASPCRNDVVGS